MQNQSFIQQVSPVLLDLLSILITGAIMFLARAVSTWLKNKVSNDAYNQLSDIALATVMSLQQTVVNPLKDPEKPGEWNENAASEIKSRAIGKIRDLAGSSIEQLQNHGWTPQMVEELIGKLVESHVLKIKDSKK
jgi:hypothetical protein